MKIDLNITVMETKSLNYRTNNPELKQRIDQIGDKVRLGIQNDKDEKIDLALSIQNRVQLRDEIEKQIEYYKKLVTSLEKMAVDNDPFLDNLYSIAEKEKQNRDSIN
jgi:hypothetical protein